jgi:hypothetical protein
MLFKVVPINPTGFIVLTIGVIIAALCPPEFIAAKQHRHTARNQQGQQEILDLAFPDDLDADIVRRSFDSIIPA